MRKMYLLIATRGREYMQVPKFKRYDPSQDDMDRHQLSFYKLVESNLNKGNYVDVDGNISYVFVFLYKLLARWNEDGFDYLFEFLIYLSEIYKHEEKLSFYCLHWAFDCLLGLEKYEEYLDKTEPKEVVGTTHYSNLRLNVQKKIGLPANPIDILLRSCLKTPCGPPQGSSKRSVRQAFFIGRDTLEPRPFSARKGRQPEFSDGFLWLAVGKPNLLSIIKPCIETAL